MEPKTIKVLLATGLYPPEIGGPATYAKMLEEQLSQHGFLLEVLPYGEVRQLPKLIRHFAFAKRLFALAKEADVIYALDPVSVGLPAWLVSVLRRKPLMLRLGGDYAWEQGQQRFGLTASLDAYTANHRRAPLPVRLLAAVQSFVARRAVRVIVPSQYLKSIVSTWGVEEQRLVVIYSALFPLVVEESKTDLRKQFSFNNFVIISIGRLVPWKGFAALIDVIAALRKEGKDVSLVIAGDGPDEGALKERIQQLKLENQVRMVGRLSKDALGATIKAADAFVLNTGYEGLSHQVLEVMDLNVPVVTTNIGGNPEIIRDGVTGLLVSYNDKEALSAAISRLYEHEQLRQRLTQTARVRSKDFTQEKVVADLANLIRLEVVKK